jgi:hypothetical protein
VSSRRVDARHDARETYALITSRATRRGMGLAVHAFAVHGLLRKPLKAILTTCFLQKSLLKGFDQLFVMVENMVRSEFCGVSSNG